MSYILTEADTEHFRREISVHVERATGYRTFCPIINIPAAKTVKDYVGTRTSRPKSSKLGLDYELAAMAMTEIEAPTKHWRNKFQIPKQVVDMAITAGVPIWSANVATLVKRYHNLIARMVLEGTNATYDTVAVTGMRAGGTVHTAPAVTGHLWDTAPAPIVHAAAGANDLVTAGFEPPFQMVCSVNLHHGMKALSDTASIRSCEDVLKESSSIDYVGYELIGTSTWQRDYPIAPATSDDGVWFMFKKDPANFYLAEFMPVTVDLNPAVNMETNCYEGYVEWAGTFLIKQATSIYYENEVNLA